MFLDRSISHKQYPVEIEILFPNGLISEREQIVISLLAKDLTYPQIDAVLDRRPNITRNTIYELRKKVEKITTVRPGTYHNLFLTLMNMGGIFVQQKPTGAPLLADSVNIIETEHENNLEIITSGDRFTTTEANIINHTLLGATNKEIGDSLGYTEETIANYLSTIYEKISAEGFNPVNRGSLSAALLATGLGSIKAIKGTFTSTQK